MDTKKTEDLIEMLGLERSVDQLAMANGVRCFCHALRSEWTKRPRTTGSEVDEAG